MIEIYVDGSCYPNPGPGGWGAVVLIGNKSYEAYGGELETTNQRMEIYAPLVILENIADLVQNQDLTIYSDSAYVVNCMNQRWHDTWRIRGWRTSSNKPVANRDLWNRLIALDETLQIKWTKVRGHVGVEYNERADQLATQGRLSISG